MRTVKKLPGDLDFGDIIVGQCDNYSQVIGEITPSYTFSGFIRIETEHGALFLDEDNEIEVKLMGT